MMRWHAAGIVATTLMVFAAPIRAQRGTDSTAFADLRIDGNGIAALDKTIGAGFVDQTTAWALTWVAQTARLNLTFDPRLEAMATRLSIPPHERSAAAALLEIARVSRISVRVSASGQIVVAPLPIPVATRPKLAVDSIAQKTVSLPALRTEAPRVERQQFDASARSGGVSISGTEVRSTPSFIEPDVLRAVQLLPGIEARSDWSAGFNVRGGEADQNLVLLDGYPIFDPFHLGGLFSTFIGPTVGRVDLRTGGMPVQYDGRLSGSLDVRSAEPSSADVHGTAEISLVSSLATAGRTFADGTGSWLVAARRTYADAVVNLVKPHGFPYHFQDFQGHLTRAIGSSARLSFTAYDGLDAAPGVSWGNSVVGATLANTIGDHPRLFGTVLGDSVTLRQRASVTRFAGHIGVPGELLHVSNGLTEWRVAGDATAHGSRWTQTLGYELARQRSSYHATSPAVSFGDLFPFDSLDGVTTAAGAYVDERWRARPNLLIEAGLRLDAVQPVQWAGVLPRLSVKYFLDRNTAVTIAGGTYAQWIHSLGREEEPIRPLQFWVAGDSVMPVSRARDATLGLERWLAPARLLHVEGFVKRYANVLRPNLASDPRVPNDEFVAENGSSYGVDFLLRQLESQSSPFSGWISYSYAFNTRVGPDGVRYFPIQDRRHNVNLVGSWRVSDYTFGARFNVGSGIPTTPVLGQFMRDRYDPITGRWIATKDNPIEQNIPASLNSARLPWYSRADVSVSRTMRWFGLPASPYLSVVNLLNVHNPAAYMYTYTSYNGRGNQASFPNLPFVPTFGVTIGY
jgi:hypothetical protein